MDMRTEKINPLLVYHQLPPFSEIQPSHVVPAVEALIQHCREGLAQTETSDGAIDWDSLVGREEQLLDELSRAWQPVSHLHNVNATEAWREAYAEAVVMLTDFYTELSQDTDRYRAYQALRQSDQFDRLGPVRQRLIENTLRDFHLAGVDLPADEKQQYRELMRELTELGTRFQQNLQDATEAWDLTFEDPSALAGLPDNELEQCRDRARQVESEGYRITLDFPSYHAVLTYADDRDLREQVYRAYNTRASDQGPHAGQWDNRQILGQILELRQRLARVVGFDNYAHYSLATKMAPDPAAAEGFLRRLADMARPRARDEMQALAAYAGQQGAPLPLQAWDLPYWSEKLRKAEFDVSEDELRPYFPLPRAIEGLMAVSGELFGITFRRRDDVDVWHPDVSFFELLNADGQVQAGLYLDLYARSGKRGGAWMADCRCYLSLADGGVQKPIAFLNCNFGPATPERPSLLSHRDLTTLFHEFGHGLHHMLTRIEHPAIGGISGVEWDAVELPSQFLENWCWERAALDRFAHHIDSGDALPDALLERMLAARHFQSGMFLCRQLEFGLTDLRLHVEVDGGDPAGVERVEQQVRDQVAVVPYPPENRFLNGFAHLFSGGYAAGYYSYLWAEQLAADAFSRFQDEGVMNPETGAAFRREVLEAGGSRPALDSFVAFRGHEPRIEPLLRSYGI